METETSIIVASISAVVTVIVFFVSKYLERQAEWRYRKIEHYGILLSAISDLALDDIDCDKDEANRRFATASNTIGIAAPQGVINALMDFHDEVKFSNRENFTIERHDKLLMCLLIEIRKDIGVYPKDNITTFKFHLIGSRPKT